MSHLKNCDKKWIGKPLKTKRSESKFMYINIVFTDLVILEYKLLLTNLIEYFNSVECMMMVKEKRDKIFKEIIRIQLMLKTK